MTRLDDFTPLESLLLFQSLSTHGTSPEAFDKISHSLRHSSLLHNDPHEISADRFSPDSLKAVYLALLKDEAKRDLQNALHRKSPQPNGDGQSPSRKRKAPSPSLPTVEEAAQHAHLVPRLIAKLYSQYRDQTIGEIRGEEKEYADLVGKLDGLEVEKDAGGAVRDDISVDEEEVAGENLSERQTRRLSVGEAQEQSDGPQNRGRISKSPDKASREESRDGIAEIKTDSGVEPRKNETPDNLTSNQERGHDEASSVTVTNEAAENSKSKMLPDHQRPYPTVSVQPTADSLDKSSTTDPQVSSQRSSPAKPPPNSSYKPPSQEPSVPGASSTSPPPATSSERANQATTPLSPQDSSNYTSHPAASFQQGRSSMTPFDLDKSNLAPTVPRQGTGSPHPTVPGQPYGTRPPHSPHHPPPPTVSNHPSNRAHGGVMLPPFQVSPQIPSSAHTAHQPKPAVTPARPQSKPSADAARQTAASGPDSEKRMLSDQTTPARPDRSHLSRADVTVSPGSNTAWRVLPESRLADQSEQAPPRDVSPISDPEDDAESARPKRVGRDGESKREQLESRSNETRPSRGGRRGRKSSQALSRSPSIAVSSAADQTRSQSAASPPDEFSATSVAQREQVKRESHTDADDVDELSLEVDKHTRRSVVASRRKQLDQEVDDTAASTGQPRVVIATRNLQRMTAPLLNNIQSHKHASLFQNPVKDRDVAGYSDIIYQPQDLKSIRAAISVGSRAVAAASAPADNPAGSPGSNSGAAPASAGVTGTTVALPWSEDLVPPRGIVNGAQLEQEVMRMFANAVMFNPGNEDVVRDTREMFETVEQSIGAWRSAERDEAVDDDAADDASARTGGGTPAGAPSASKRRRL